MKPQISPRTRREVTISLRSAYFATVGALIAVLLIILLIVGYLDLKEVVSLAIGDAIVILAVSYLSGESRRSTLAEAASLADVAREFSHLRGHVFWTRSHLLGTQLYYVENTLTKCAYWAPDWVEELVDLGVITTKRYESYGGKEMEDEFQRNGIKLEEHYAKFLQLWIATPVPKQLKSYSYFE